MKIEERQGGRKGWGEGRRTRWCRKEKMRREERLASSECGEDKGAFPIREGLLAWSLRGRRLLNKGVNSVKGEVHECEFLVKGEGYLCVYWKNNPTSREKARERMPNLIKLAVRHATCLKDRALRFSVITCFFF